AGKAAAQIRGVAPLAAKVTLRAMQQTRRDTPSIEQVLARDYRVMTRFLDTHDLRDGIRAMVVDKHDSPTWSPSVLEDVTERMVERHFAALGENQLQIQPAASSENHRAPDRVTIGPANNRAVRQSSRV